VSAAPPPRSRPIASSRPPAGRTALRPLELLTLAHVGFLLLASSWYFGGESAGAWRLLCGWGSLGGLITVAACANRPLGDPEARTSLRPLWPFAAFNALVLLSCLNPSFSVKGFEGQTLLAYQGAAHPALPSTADPLTSLRHLWLFDAIFLSCFNLPLVIQRCRALRALLLVACANAVLLAVFGTFQKLLSTGLYFGRVPSPNPRFFATFIYGNHWAAYVVLMIAAAAGLIFFHLSRHARGERHGSPLPLGLVSLLLMAMTPVICGSRAGTVLVLVLLAGGTSQILLHFRRRAGGASAAWPVAGLALGAALAAGGAIYLGRAALRERWSDTQGQWQAGLVRERLSLYADTWHLAAAQPAFGWGLGNFDKALLLARPRPVEPRRQYEHSYVDAHSDWLQSVAEVGFAGTLLVALCAVLPLAQLRARHFAGSLTGYLLAGCGLILLYAGVEFPFGNPAVVIAFWTCFFCAVHHGRLQDRKSGTPLPPSASPAP
jgi:O-antigen ligase